MAEPLVYILTLNYRAWRDTVVCLGAVERPTVQPAPPLAQRGCALVGCPARLAAAH